MIPLFHVQGQSKLRGLVKQVSHAAAPASDPDTEGKSIWACEQHKFV